MAELTPNQYRCAKCKGVFDKEWSDEDAKAEHDRDFPGSPFETACIVCGDCYKAFTAVRPLLDLLKNIPGRN